MLFGKGREKQDCEYLKGETEIFSILKEPMSGKKKYGLENNFVGSILRVKNQMRDVLNKHAIDILE